MYHANRRPRAIVIQDNLFAYAKKIKYRTTRRFKENRFKTSRLTVEDANNVRSIQSMNHCVGLSVCATAVKTIESIHLHTPNERKNGRPDGRTVGSIGIGFH